MRSAVAAEWLLSLVTDPDRAAATVGDLVEEDRGAVRFWSSILQTAASHVALEIWNHPFTMLRVTVVVCFETMLALLALAAVVNFIIRTWIQMAPYQTGPLSVYIPRWGYLMLIAMLLNGASFVSGWEAARQSKGREIAAGVAVFACFVMIGALLPSRNG